MARTVVLRSSRGVGGSRYLGATLTDGGDLVMEGQDLGSGVSEIFGEGLTEYEWKLTIRETDLPAAVAALGGTPDADVLGLLAFLVDQLRDFTIRPTLERAGVPFEFWNRVGD